MFQFGKPKKIRRMILEFMGINYLCNRSVVSFRVDVVTSRSEMQVKYLLTEPILPLRHISPLSKLGLRIFLRRIRNPPGNSVYTTCKKFSLHEYTGP